MTVQQLQVLKLLYKLTNHSEKRFYYDENEQLFFLYDGNGIVNCSKFSSQIIGLLNNLQSYGYIEKVTINSFTVDDNILRLTYRGLHPLYFSVETVMGFLIKSIVVPIVVAFITALLVS